MTVPCYRTRNESPQVYREFYLNDQTQTGQTSQFNRIFFFAAVFHLFSINCQTFSALEIPAENCKQKENHKINHQPVNKAFYVHMKISFSRSFFRCCCFDADEKNNILATTETNNEINVKLLSEMSTNTADSEKKLIFYVDYPTNSVSNHKNIYIDKSFNFESVSCFFLNYSNNATKLSYIISLIWIFRQKKNSKREKA